MVDRRVAVVVQEADVGFAPNLFSYRVFGSVKLGDKEWPAVLEKTGVRTLWAIEFFQYEAPWSRLKLGNVVTFIVGPKQKIDLTVGDHPTETGTPDT